MFDIFKENEPEKKYSKQTVAVHLYIFLAQGCKYHAHYMLQSPYCCIHCTWCIIELYSEALMAQTNEINCTFFFSLFSFLSWCKKKEMILLQMGMLVGQYILNTSPKVVVFAWNGVRSMCSLYSSIVSPHHTCSCSCTSYKISLKCHWNARFQFQVLFQIFLHYDFYEMTHENLKYNISIKHFVYSGQIVQNGNVNKNSNDCSTLLLAVYTVW